MLGLVKDCRNLLKNVHLIQKRFADNLFASAALREVSAAERFRRVLDRSANLLDSDPRLQFQVATRQWVAEAGGGSASEIKTAIPPVQYRFTTGQPLETTGFAARPV